MGVHSLSVSEKKLLEILDIYAYTGTLYVDIKRGLYEAMFTDTTDISAIPFPSGTVLKRVYQ